MRDTPLVSVIIPVFNGASYIREALRSVAEQTYSNLEIVVVDDGSSDSSASIVEQLRDPRIKLHKQDNQGRCAARNRGLELSSGELLKYLDQDDILDSDSIRSQVDDLSTEGPSVISMGTLKVFDTNVRDSVDLGFFHRFARCSDPIDFYYTLGEHAVQTSVWLTPRLLHLKGGYWDTSLQDNPMDDGELFMRILMNATAVKYCSRSLVYHRRGSANRGSSHTTPMRIVSCFRSLELCTQHLLNRENSPKTREICARMFKHYLYMHFSFDRSLRKSAFKRMKDLGFPKVNYYLGGMTFRILDRVFGPRVALRIRWICGRMGRQ
jgi:glycosyltransferase involved in cell wall biosynthesis